MVPEPSGSVDSDHVDIDLWRSGSGYEAYVGRWSRRVAYVFIDRLDVRPGSRWVDVGCGTGAVMQTVLMRCEPASILGVDRSETFLEVARSSIDDPRASFDVADGASIPLADDTVDAAVSGLVLNFVPDPVAMLAEMRRVTRPGGTVAIYVWDYGDGMQIMRHFWDAAIEQDPRVAATAESLRFEICKPEPLRAAFQDAGLADIEVEPIDVPTVFRDFDDYWQPFLMSTAPAPRHAMSLSDTDRANLRERIRARLPIADDGSIPLTARAWAVRATD
jgi:ubiquinone/menaquinone biosynthesis C-methylase UbiE